VTLSSAVAARLAEVGLLPGDVEQLVHAALAEDLHGGVDVTSVATVPEGQHSTGVLVARADGVVAGLPVAEAVLEVASGGTVGVAAAVHDGDRVVRGDVLARVSGPTRALLTGERTTLNLLCHLSGVATLTRRWVDAVAGTGAKVRDTRKTTPGLRALEKYAVRCGGGVNHRMSLSDAALVKDNHVVAAGGVVPAFAAVRDRWPGLLVEVEVDSLEQLAEVLDAGADLVLLDNMAPDLLRSAVELTAGRAAEVAATGVDYLSVGALTHSAPVLDIALDLTAADARAEGSA
jgi:nicotinate-nucleotide pyrophosphorylase (carboxylating)